jgi:hypothetical protein
MMFQQRPNSELGSSVLKQIQEDMKVYDREGKEIGTVESVYLGAVDEEVEAYGGGPATSDDPDWPGEGSLIDNLAEVFNPDEMPEVLRNRLLHHGFIRIDSSGLFSSDRYATPDQIRVVSGDDVYLNVSQDELIKR